MTGEHFELTQDVETATSTQLKVFKKETSRISPESGKNNG